MSKNVFTSVQYQWKYPFFPRDITVKVKVTRHEDPEEEQR
jgi:hypothetical protein